MTEQTAKNVVGPRPSLANKFSTPPDRGAAVAGLLAPRPTATPTPATVVAEPAVVAGESAGESNPTVASVAAPVADATPTVRASTAARKPTASKPSAKPARAGTVKQVSAYLEPDLYELVMAAVRKEGITHDALLVRSFEKVTDDALRALWAPTVSSTTMPTREVRQRGSAGIQRQFQLSHIQTEWLDRKMEEVGAPSRSALIAAVLGLALRNA